MPAPLPPYPTLRSRYDAFLMLERGLADNTREAYLRDLDSLHSFMARRGIDFPELSTDDLERFVEQLYDLGIAPRSVARVISGFKSAMRYLRLEGIIESNPAALLDGPRLGRHLPDVLSVDEIDAMIDAIDLESPTGRRNRAIIETMYGCGLRVSAICRCQKSILSTASSSSPARVTKNALCPCLNPQ